MYSYSFFNSYVAKIKIIFFTISCFVIFLQNSFLLAENIEPSFESESIFGIEEPQDYKDSSKTIYNADENKLILPKPVGGNGYLHVIIESVEALNESLISKKADKIEIWLGHLLLSRLDSKDSKVFDHKSSRHFDFPVITLKSGYYFITVRVYSKGFIWKGDKYHEETYQVGIHEGKRTTLRKKIPVLNW